MLRQFVYDTIVNKLFPYETDAAFPDIPRHFVRHQVNTARTTATSVSYTRHQDGRGGG